MMDNARGDGGGPSEGIMGEDKQQNCDLFHTCLSVWIRALDYNTITAIIIIIIAIIYDNVLWWLIIHPFIIRESWGRTELQTDCEGGFGGNIQYCDLAIEFNVITS